MWCQQATISQPFQVDGDTQDMRILNCFLELAMNPAPFGMYIKRYDKLLSPQCRISAISMYDAAATCLLVHMAKAVT